jgi:tetratricopeptide (TPR) repeat protein
VELFAGLVRRLNPRAEEQGAPPLYEQLRTRAAKATDELVGEAVGDPEAVARLQMLLGETLLELGDAGKAVEVLERARATREVQLSADHPGTLATLTNLATAYQAAGKLPEAIVLLEQVRDAKVKKLGADHPDTLTTLNNLAGAYRAADKLPEAIALLEQAAAGIEKRRFQHEYAGRTISNTISAYEQANQLDKAEAWRRKWLAVAKQRAGVNSPAYAGELAALGLNLLDQKKWTEAETSLKECLALREKTQPDVWSTFNTKSMLGGALLGQKKYAAAEPLLLAGCEGMKKRADKIPRQAKDLRLREAVKRLVQLYEAMEKKDEAAKWRKELEGRKGAPKEP